MTLNENWEDGNQIIVQPFQTETYCDGVIPAFYLNFDKPSKKGTIVIIVGAVFLILIMIIVTTVIKRKTK